MHNMHTIINNRLCQRSRPGIIPTIYLRFLRHVFALTDDEQSLE